MSVQFPTLSQPEQQQRYSDEAKATLYPYSYPFYILPTGTNFAASYPLFGGNYMTWGIQADNNFSISDLHVQVSVVFENASAAYLGRFGIEISYLSIPILTPFSPTNPPAIPTAPTDVGNIIYRNFINVHVLAGASGAGNDVQTIFNIDDYQRYEPYNYLLKYNQILYIHMITDATTITKGALFAGNITFHTLATGLKV